MWMEKKQYVFSNFYSKQKKEDWKEVKVFAEDILEAKLKIKEMGLEHFKFERIYIYYEKIK
jgi:hypothetical protein